MNDMNDDALSTADEVLDSLMCCDADVAPCPRCRMREGDRR